ncbi:hypothetical protein [Acidisphaera sp. S103]|uniref:hypothetical protein n=1 Tax=Acidisphaera sp. S103 TaxID=1747223 RepID=UPI00131C3893|nr:hypothetical protein [Acidisphaera sp. S103]
MGASTGCRAICDRLLWQMWAATAASTTRPVTDADWVARGMHDVGDIHDYIETFSPTAARNGKRTTFKALPTG